MSTVQRIAKNSAVLIIAQLLTTALGFFYIMYTARYLGAAGFGILTFALAFTQLFGVLSSIGVGPLTVREVARNRAEAPKYVANVALMKLLLAFVAFSAIALIINLMDYPQETVYVVYLVGLSVILMSLTQIPYSIFQAFERMEYVSMGRIMSAGLLLIGLIPALRYDFSVVGFAYLYVFANGVVLLFSIGILVWRFFTSSEWPHHKMRIDWGFWKPTLRKALPFGLSGIAMSLLHYVDTVMLSAMVADANQVVGWYNGAYRLVFMVQSVRQAMGMAVFPVMSRAYATSKESLVLICERFFKYYVILALPIGVGTTVLATRFILVVYGPEYLKAVIALQILVWSAVIMFMNFAPSLFQSIDRQLTVTKIALFGAAVNIALNLLVIPRFSYTGAAATTIATNVIALAISFAVFSKTEYSFPLSFALKNLTKVLVATGVMGWFAWYFQDLHLAAVVILSALLYLALLFLMRTFDNTDSRILASLLRGEVLSLGVDQLEPP